MLGCLLATACGTLPPLFGLGRLVRYFELMLGLRYTRAKRRNHFISFISLASMMGIALGVLALIVVLSVMNGFQKEIRAKLLGASSHIELQGNPALANWPVLLQKTRQHPEVIGAAPFVLSQGLLTWESSVRGTMVRGIDPALEKSVAEIDQHMQDGKMADLVPGEFNIVLGSELARQLGVFVGDKVVLVAPEGQVTPAGVLPRLKQFKVVGVFRLDMYILDSGLAIVHIKDAQKLYRMGEAVSGIRVKVADSDRAPLVRKQLMATLPGDIYATDWTLDNATYFQAVQVERAALTLILALIVLVAAFNLVSSLVMLVTDKQSDIAILRTLGATPGSVMSIFIVQGAVIGTLGTLLGVVGGVSLALNIDVLVPWLERTLHTHFISPEVYFLSSLPSDLHWSDVTIITVFSLVLSFLATLYPSWRAARIQPAEALRYE